MTTAEPAAVQAVIAKSHPAERRVNITLSGGKDRVSHEPVDNDERELVCDTGEDERRSGARTTRRPRPQGQSSCRRRSEHTHEVAHRHRPHHIPAAIATNTTDRYGRWDRWQLPSHSCVPASAQIDVQRERTTSLCHCDPHHVVSASRSPVSVPSPTQATCPSGRTNTALGGLTAPSAGSSHTATCSASTTWIRPRQ